MEDKIKDITETSNNNEKETVYQNPLQTQDYYAALKKIEDDKQRAKKKKRKKAILIVCAVVLAIFLYDFSSSAYEMEKYFNRIESAILEGDNELYQKSFEDFLYTTHSNDDIAKMYYKVGKVFLENERYDNAVNVFQKGIEYSDKYLKKINKVYDSYISKERDIYKLYSLFMSCFNINQDKELSENDNNNLYNLIKSCYDEREFLMVYNLLGYYTGNEDVSELVNSGNYYYALSIIEDNPSDAYTVFEELDGYKKSVELAKYAEYLNRLRYLEGQYKYEAEKDLKSMLKNQSSLEIYSKTCSSYLSKSAIEEYCKISFLVTISYSATNSFGARLDDIYQDRYADSLYMGDVPYETLEKMKDMNTEELISYAYS